MVEANASREQGRIEKYIEALGDVKAMHLLRAQVSEGITPFEDLSRDLNLLSNPHFPIEEWWKSFNRLKDAELIEVRDEKGVVVVTPSTKGRELISNGKRLAQWGRTLTGSF